MKLKHLVAAVAAVFATGAIAAGEQQGQHSSSQGAMSQSQGQQQQAQSQSPEVIRQVQQGLNQKGFDVGAVDGIWGPKTQQGVKQFQQSQNIEATGQLDRQTLSALGVEEQSSAVGGSSAGNASGGSSQSGEPGAQSGGSSPGGGSYSSGSSGGSSSQK